MFELFFFVDELSAKKRRSHSYFVPKNALGFSKAESLSIPTQEQTVIGIGFLAAEQLSTPAEDSPNSEFPKRVIFNSC